MKRPDKIFLASGNQHKIEELKQLLAPEEIQIRSTLDYSTREDVVEDQADLKGNALKKAEFWFEKTGLTTLADDTGLEVDALDGRPGVYSARYAGENASYRDNMEKLLNELDGKTDRRARFRTVIALVGDETRFFEGVCEGEILSSPRGEKGFGYDPVFRPSGYVKSFAELEPDEKNRISHRGKALRKVAEYFRS